MSKEKQKELTHIPEIDELIIKYGIVVNITNWSEEMWLNHLIIPPKYKGQGLGSFIMNALINYANTEHKQIKLLPANCYGTDVDVLIDFYGRFGFEMLPNKKKRPYMVYYPKDKV